MKKFLFISICSIFLFSCNNNNGSVDPNASALPHGDALPTSELSAEDKLKLAQAKGKKAELISVRDIEQMFDAAVGKLHIFSFWSVDCKECMEMNQSLQKIASETAADKVKIILINTDGIKARAKVNTYIREKGIITESYIINAASKNWTDGLHEQWNGKLPAIFLVNDSEEINQLSQIKMDEGEFNAIVSSLSL